MSTPFCSLSDVTNTGIPASAFGTLSSAQKQACVDYANAWVGARLNGRYPGINAGGSGWTWDESVTGSAVSIAVQRMLDTRGRNPTTGNADKVIDEAAKDARAFILDVQRQQAHPYITGGEAAGATSQGPTLTSTSASYTNSSYTDPNRGI